MQYSTMKKESSVKNVLKSSVFDWGWDAESVGTYILMCFYVID